MLLTEQSTFICLLTQSTDQLWHYQEAKMHQLLQSGNYVPREINSNNNKIHVKKFLGCVLITRQAHVIEHYIERQYKEH